MGPQVLLIPTLFVAICVSFIILHSCYHRWKVGAILRKKRDAAKISLVNILQMTNATLITPAWSSTNAVKSKIRPKLFVSDESTSSDDSTVSSPVVIKKGINSSSATFNPRNPNVLSSVLTLSDVHHIPPPCYEDLYGTGDSVFTFKSLSPDREEPPPFSAQFVENGNYVKSLQIPTNVKLKADEQSQYFIENGNNPCPLQVTPEQQVFSVPSQERRNSSAVLYL